MAKVFVTLGVDGLMGHLRYGHKEGTIDIPDDEIESFKEDPINYIVSNDLQDELEFFVDDYEIDWADGYCDPEYKVVE